jgi:hypothetical protein
MQSLQRRAMESTSPSCSFVLLLRGLSNYSELLRFEKRLIPLLRNLLIWDLLIPDFLENSSIQVRFQLFIVNLVFAQVEYLYVSPCALVLSMPGNLQSPGLSPTHRMSMVLPEQKCPSHSYG